MATEHREREDKYDVGAGFVLPDLGDLVAPGGRVQRVQLDLESVYFDTSAHDLLRHKVTLRRRSGGGEDDTGWQLKVPAGAARTELRLGPTTDSVVPRELRDLTTGIRGARSLQRVGTLRTSRSALRVLDEDGGLVVEVVDDRVQATAGGGDEGATTGWREVEVELGTGDEALLAQIGSRLRGAGATPSPAASKIGRALGLPETADGAPRDAPARSVVADDLARLHSAILLGDLALRRDAGDVHPGEEAVRRLRDVLGESAGLFDPVRLAALADGLAWYAGLLASARDPRVPAGRPALLRAMGSRRYLALLDEIAGWVESPPLARAAGAAGPRLSSLPKPTSTR